MGARKANPAVRGDTAREAAYRASHRHCGVCGKPGTPAEPLTLHHIGRRQNRATSRLMMLCLDHHTEVHAGRLDDGRQVAAGAVKENT